MNDKQQQNEKPPVEKVDKKVQERKEFIKSILIAISIAVVFRSFLYEPFFIPSGSMKSTLLVGDFVFVDKKTYGYSRYSLPFGLPIIPDRVFKDEPKRGDVVVFKLPKNTSTNYVKRLIGMPGDTIEVKNSILYLNGKIVPRKRIDDFIDEDKFGNTKSIPQYIETLPSGREYTVLDELKKGPLDNTLVYNVPEGHYFMMGDNRDNSQDSRVLSQVGYIPEINLLGPAKIIAISAKDSLLKVWKWLSMFRTERFLMKIK